MTGKDVECILLYHSKFGFDQDLANLTEQIKQMNENRSIISAIKYDIAVSKNKNNVSVVEMNVIRNFSRLELEQKANELSKFINRLDYVIENLPEIEKNIIKLRYFNKYGTVTYFTSIAYKLNYSETWCETLNRRALERIVRSLKGYKITWEVEN